MSIIKRRKKTYCVYILASKKNGTLYTGFTCDLIRRAVEHKTSNKKSFTKKYDIKLLVYYETSNYVLNAIRREKQIKKWSRKKKIDLIESMNPEWVDLSIDMMNQEEIDEISRELDRAYSAKNTP